MDAEVDQDPVAGILDLTVGVVQDRGDTGVAARDLLVIRVVGAQVMIVAAVDGGIVLELVRAPDRGATRGPREGTLEEAGRGPVAGPGVDLVRGLDPEAVRKERHLLLERGIPARIPCRRSSLRWPTTTVATVGMLVASAGRLITRVNGVPWMTDGQVRGILAVEGNRGT